MQGHTCLIHYQSPTWELVDRFFLFHKGMRITSDLQRKPEAEPSVLLLQLQIGRRGESASMLYLKIAENLHQTNACVGSLEI